MAAFKPKSWLSSRPDEVSLYYGNRFNFNVSGAIIAMGVLYRSSNSEVSQCYGSHYFITDFQRSFRFYTAKFGISADIYDSDIRITMSHYPFITAMGSRRVFIFTRSSSFLMTVSMSL